MKTITKGVSYWVKDNLVHIETELGILNIRLRLQDIKGRKVEAFSFSPDDKIKGERKVVLRMSKGGARFRQLKRVN